jgi:cell division inhibitor SulA
MTLDEWNDIVNSLRAELAEARREALKLAGDLGEAHAFLVRIGYGTGVGSRPLAGGVSIQARELLERHGVTLSEDSESAA